MFFLHQLFCVTHMFWHVPYYKWLLIASVVLCMTHMFWYDSYFAWLLITSANFQLNHCHVVCWDVLEFALNGSQQPRCEFIISVVIPLQPQLNTY